MMQVRVGVFETNSSSTHSITMCSDSEYQRWKNGEVFFTGKYGLDGTDSKYANEVFIDVDMLRDVLKHLTYVPCEFDPDTIDDVRFLYRLAKDACVGVYNYKDFFAQDEYETYVESHTTPSGDKVVAFGYYGYDG